MIHLFLSRVLNFINMSATVKNNALSYKGSQFLRERLILSLLSGKSVQISEIRANDGAPGVKEFEVNLIRLVDCITNGCIIKIDYDGTSLNFQPGLLNGGKFTHECSSERGIGYYLEALVMLGPFCKTPLNVTLKGVTCNNIDPSVDHISKAYLPILKEFIVDDEGLEIKIHKRGMLPLGGGEIQFQCPIKRTLRAVQCVDIGLVKKIRGVAYSLRVSAALSNRMIDAAKGVLLNFIPDVYISVDQRKGKQSGNSPGFGIFLIAETTKGIYYAAEQVSKTVATNDDISIPEDVGRACAQKLLKNIFIGGCTDPAAQSIAVLFMALSQNNVSKFVLGQLSEYTIKFLQHLKEFFGITFKIEYEPDEDDDIIRGNKKISVTCIGCGFSNLNKRIT